MPTPAASEFTRFFRADDIGALECQAARYVDYSFAPHFHEEYVVNTLLDGVQSYAYQGGQYRAGRGALVLVNPGAVHTGEAGSDGGWAYCGYFPSVTLMRQLAEQLTGRPTEPFFRDTVVVDPDLSVRLARLHHLLRHSDDRLLRESWLHAVLGDVVARHMLGHAPQAVQARHNVERVRQMLADRLADNLSLTELAAVVGLSPYHLNRSFRAAYGLPPIAWRNQLRLVRGRALLGQGVPAGEVASRLGFADQPHFTRAFRQALGITPAAYQQGLGVAPRRALTGS
ncbi:AraC family transcriptional regulator [Crenobacter sp. SG2305]|uniref:helix-turn-helix domain-containing protein n=1 Tax=Crenobacter oryzisoli TaxID=3056844 RepID=UPI0025AA6603|nr:AraC family transcriptional regulator [Crenobacter sp. SG2305]MDN0081204.1 AraC family transcriptional regulator [Crenobacter sp. SG2305]